MARFEVLKAYTDKNTGRVCYSGEILEEAQERAEELAQKGFVKLLEAAEEKPKKRASRKKVQ